MGPQEPAQWLPTGTAFLRAVSCFKRDVRVLSRGGARADAAVASAFSGAQALCRSVVYALPALPQKARKFTKNIADRRTTLQMKKQMEIDKQNELPEASASLRAARPLRLCLRHATRLHGEAMTQGAVRWPRTAFS